ncbi:bifunctional YncE family protein/alkaline phosphatase family protein [Actinocrinis puniceicyclus]|uniref:Bifunctional YncE family protein/alkaline phosphatase family protein n=1 Tax=Actinocrinis puniceicyclus TaxID=977794 RepID=A0A8J7WPG7_9ACTN|nr:bifunctional YncE family protein/alkaline phosphatase family protein [Actinocrinis puniceicyclus]MBS2963614.1 bifunctional YncE family protein/alkaline phosphatase family protein [Actinocrinis puniceicyclus]
MRTRIKLWTAASCALVLGTGTAFAVVYGPNHHAGPQGNGAAYTPVGWKVTPAGRQAALGSLPTSTALSPDGRLLAVLDAGDATNEQMQVVDTRTGAVVDAFAYTSPEGVYAGVAFSKDGSRLYASGGGSEKIHVFDVAAGKVTKDSDIALPTKNPAGVAVNLYPAGLAVTPDGSRLVVADQLADAVSIVTVATGAVATVGVGHNPYAVALSPDGRTAYVSDQGSNTVDVLDVSGPAPVKARSVTVGTHPNREVVDPHTGTLYVANGDSDTISVIRRGTGVARTSFDLAPYRNAPVGSNPDGLALSADGRTLYVANSGNNDIDVVHVSSGRVEGMIPTGWYPTSVTVSSDGRKLFVTNAKGLGAGPNDAGGGPNPTQGDGYGTGNTYIGTMIDGTLSTISTPGTAQLNRYSRQVVSNDGFDERDKVREAVAANPVPDRIGASSPIKHVIYVVRENRTYDQEFGSLGKGNGDAALNLFGDDSAPNSRALERQYVTLDNFYADAEISAQGWNWSVGANSNPYVEQTWVGNYSGRNHPYDYEGGNLATAPNNDPLDAYIWDRLADKGVSFRNYGFYESDNVLNTGSTGGPDPRLAANTDPHFYGWDLAVPDSSGTFAGPNEAHARIDEWQKEFSQYVANGDLPKVELLRLPNDHTATTRLGAPTPQAYVADNDYALGRLVDTVSHSAYWSSTAIFVVEDDAQDGPDHVDAHRTTAEVISPYTRTGKVDSTFYSTVSMLRTIELLVGIKPLTQFDASATPMFNAFTPRPDFAPYSAIKPAASVLTAVNGAGAPLSVQTSKMDYTQEDRLNDQLANLAIWESVKGTGSPYPGAQHHVFPGPGPADAAGTGALSGSDN